MLLESFRDFKVRPACTKDTAGVENLVRSIHLNENILKDLQQFNKARRDEVLNNLITMDSVQCLLSNPNSYKYNQLNLVILIKEVVDNQITACFAYLTQLI